MGVKLSAGAAVTAALLVSGCAGVPAAVSFVSLYANTLLITRTNKGVTDHVVSALADQDCGFVNILTDGRYCTDAPAPDVVAMMSADADHLTVPVQVAAATSPKIASDVVPQPVLITDTKVPPPRATAATSATTTTTTAAATTAAIPRTGGPAVVVGSYRQQANALARIRQLQRNNALATAQMIPVAVSGAPLYRVIVPAATLEEARRFLASARAGGAPDAWLLPQAGNTTPDDKPTTRTANPGDTPLLPVTPRREPRTTMVAEADATPTL